MNRFIKTAAFTAAAAASLAALSGCSTATTAAKAPAEPVVLDGAWMMVLPKGSDCEVSPTIEFNGTKMTGDLGCNRAMGNVQFDGHNIDFSTVASTRKLCAPAYMKVESQMTAWMAAARTVTKTKEGLNFFDADGKKVVTLVPELAGSCD